MSVSSVPVFPHLWQNSEYRSLSVTARRTRVHLIGMQNERINKPAFFRYATCGFFYFLARKNLRTSQLTWISPKPMAITIQPEGSPLIVLSAAMAAAEPAKIVD